MDNWHTTEHETGSMVWPCTIFSGSNGVHVQMPPEKQKREWHRRYGWRNYKDYGANETYRGKNLETRQELVALAMKDNDDDDDLKLLHQRIIIFFLRQIYQLIKN